MDGQRTVVENPGTDDGREGSLFPSDRIGGRRSFVCRGRSGGGCKEP